MSIANTETVMANEQSGQLPTYSFLIHSGSSSSHEASLDLPKQKRKRTSPHDHAVLEAAYLRNSKPDKNERADIVSRVELGEKEVQIWFQNRRQNDRRKSKPLQPHELLAHLRNGLPTKTPPPTEHEHEHVSFTESESQRSSQNLLAPNDVPRPLSRSSSIHELLNPAASSDEISPRQNVSSSQEVEPISTPLSSFEDPDKPTSSNDLSNAAPSGPTHIRKRSYEAMVHPTTEIAPNIVDAAPLPRPSLPKRSSFVRLAMTVDGAVKVRTTDEATPSPPKQHAPPPESARRRSAGLGRSQSAVENGFIFKDINPPIRAGAGGGFGRSKDARTWEFYCDRDSANALSAQAEAERNGSAVGAINLIRSNSQRSKVHALSPNLAKQNKRRIPVEQNLGKARLSRTQSSLGRLQGFDGVTEVDGGKAKRARHARSPSGDSDKENWAPGTRVSNHPLRRTQPSESHAPVLQENESMGPRASSSDSTIVQSEAGASTGTGKEKAKGDDLDCIQGLLSLSQGAWR